MKKILFLFALTYSSITIAQTISPDAIATSGTSFNDGTSQLDWTLGESVTATFVAGSDMLTQGFHQPNLMITSINNVETDYSVMIFPNPTIDHIQLQFQNLKQNVAVELFSTEGKLLQSQNINSANHIQLDMSNYSAGTYLLSIKSNDSRIKTYQVIKLK